MEMMLRAKIKPKYLDLALEGKKQVECREIEGIELSDGKRTVTFAVTEIDSPDDATRHELYRRYPDVPWTRGLMVRIWLGKILFKKAVKK